MNEREPIDWDRVRVDAKYLGDCLFVRAGDGRDDPTFFLLLGVATAWLWRATPGAEWRPLRPILYLCDGGKECSELTIYECTCANCREQAPKDRKHWCATHDGVMQVTHSQRRQRFYGHDGRLDAGCDFQIGPLGSPQAWCDSQPTMRCVCPRCSRETEACDRFHTCGNHVRDVELAHERMRGRPARWTPIEPAQNRTAVSQENAPPAAAEKKPFRERYADTLLSQADRAFLEGRADDDRCLRAYERLCLEVLMLEKSIEVVDVNLESFFELRKGVHAVAELVRQFGMGGSL